jgi:hypothetical protein
MKVSRNSSVCLMVLSGIAAAGCRATSTSPESAKIAGYEVRASSGVGHSLVEPAFRAALGAPEVKITPERFPLVRVGTIPEKAPDQALRVEFQGYMDGYAVMLTNSVSGWRAAWVHRMIE